MSKFLLFDTEIALAIRIMERFESERSENSEEIGCFFRVLFILEMYQAMSDQEIPYGNL
jgi:hypothetical protein